MEQRLSFVTLAVHDLAATRRFYLDGLGWQPALDVPDEVIMIQVGPQLVLSLWSERGFEEEVGPIRRGAGMIPVTMAHNVRTEAEVDDVLATARAAGAEIFGPTRREWGGYSGYFADPDGFRWEVAYNPDDIGNLVLPEPSGR